MDQKILDRVAAARAALAEMPVKESVLAQEAAMLWLDIAACGFAALPSGYSGWARLHWNEEGTHSCDPMVRCPAGSIFPYEALIISTSYNDDLYMSKIRGEIVITELIPEADVLPGAPWEALRQALAVAREGFRGFLSASISAAPGAPGFDGASSWNAQAKGEALQEAASLAREIGMHAAAARWESRLVSQAAEPAKASIKRPRAL